MIKFDEIEEKQIPNFHGGEGVTCAAMFVDDVNRIMRGKLSKGCSIGLHRHDTSSEILYVLSGQGQTICDGVEERLSAGDCHYCKKGSQHTLINIGEEDLIFFAVVPQQ